MTKTSLPVLADPDEFALFCDFDGTLVEIAAHPEAVSLRPSTRQAIERLLAALGGAFAVVTGRDIASIDSFLSPLRVPAAGVHGLIRRDASGRLHGSPAEAPALLQAAECIERFASSAVGLLVERKSGAVALHYRERPELEDACIAAMEKAVDGAIGIRVRRGKMVGEAAPAYADKGRAVEAFMSEPPFAARRPIFVGDDTTDEDAFAVVNRMGGSSIKIGGGPTCAVHVMEGTAAFLAWLEASAVQLGERAPK